MPTNPDTDQTAYVEVLARLLCAADVHVHGDEHPTWQHLVGETGSRIRDDYRAAARWLLPRMTVTRAASPVAVPPTGQTALRDLIAEALAAALMPRYGGPQHNTPGGLPLTATAEEVALHRAQPLADAVLAVLPDDGRADAWREAADRLAAKYSDDDPAVEDLRQWADAELRRMADEAQQPEPENACAHCGSSEHSWDDCKAYTALTAEEPDVGAQQPASTAPLAAGLPLVQGACPACHSASLFLGNGGYVTCSQAACPEPDAATTVLEREADAAGGAGGVADETGEGGDRLVAHTLATGTDLHCLRCAPPPYGDIWTPVIADELEDGGVCVRCGVDVLIPQEADRG